MTRIAYLLFASLLSCVTAIAQENDATRKLIQQSEQFEEQIIKVADNVHVAVGYSVSNVSMIIGDDGVAGQSHHLHALARRSHWRRTRVSGCRASANLGAHELRK